MDDPYQPIYFVGITLPPDLDQQIADLKRRLYDKKSSMLKPLLPHVTLLHPPSLQGVMPSELIPRVHTIAKRYLPLTVELTEIGFFDQRVCYLRAESLKLSSLQAQLVNLLPEESQAQHYKRPYLPHVTLAQIYEPKMLDVESAADLVNKSLRLPISFKVESVSYFQRIMPRVYVPHRA